MRFSLATLVLLVLWAGAVIAIWVRREPWVLVAVRPISHETTNLNSWLISPDNKRLIMMDEQRTGQLLVYENQKARDEQEPLCSISTDQPLTDIFAHKFIDNDTFEGAQVHNGANKNHEISIATYHRRFPEWWWGHFYRPEVWLALALSAALIWQAVRAKKERGAKRPAQPETKDQKPETIPSSQ